MKIIEVVGTNIKISVSNAQEMYSIFFQLHSWGTLKIDNDIYPADLQTGYTKGYFQAKYWG